MNVVNRKTLGTVCLAIATFLNPFGFDILVFKLTQLTNDYWSTMFVLYGFSALLFGLSFLFFKRLKRKIGNFLLGVALFINPLGYDLVVHWINSLTNDYWMTMSIMYALAGMFFLAFLKLYNVNPITTFKYQTKKVHKKITTNFKGNDG